MKLCPHEPVKFCLWMIIGPLEIKWFYSNPRSYFTLLLRRQIFQHYILTCFEKSLKFLCRSTYPIIMGYVKWSMVLSSPEPKAQVSFSDQNLSVVRRFRRKLSHFSLLLQIHWANFNQTWHKASLDDSDLMFCK